jgi:hypothetical protein
MALCSGAVLSLWPSTRCPSPREGALHPQRQKPSAAAEGHGAAARNRGPLQQVVRAYTVLAGHRPLADLALMGRRLRVTLQTHHACVLATFSFLPLRSPWGSMRPPARRATSHRPTRRHRHGNESCHTMTPWALRHLEKTPGTCARRNLPGSLVEARHSATARTP